MELSLTLALPRDEYSVPVARRVLKSSLGTLGVRDDVTGDIELALTEACTNVLDHARDTGEYELSVSVDGQVCSITVVDRGEGFDGSAVGFDDAEASAEGGRGIQLMRSLVDRVTFTSRPRAGTVVHLEKELEWEEDAPVKRLEEHCAD